MAKLALFREGYLATLPLMVGVAPFGVVFGALAVATGLTSWQAAGMSMLVFAGSSQFIAVELVGQGAGLGVILATTFLINLRNFLYTASLAAEWRSLSATWQALLAYPIADENYAVIVARRRRGDLAARELGWFAAGAGVNLVSVWWLSTAVGALLGDFLPPQLTGTLGFTLPLIFVSLIVPGLTTRPALAAAFAALLAGIVLAPLPHHLGLLVAAGIGIGAGVTVEGLGSVGVWKIGRVRGWENERWERDF